MSATVPSGPTGSSPPTDEALSAWIDDELPAAQRASVEAWLGAHPDDAARVRRWSSDRDALAARFQGVIEEPVPTRLEQLVWSRAPATVEPARWWRLAAAVAIFAAGIGVGGGVAWRVAGPADGPAVASSGWVHRAALAHAVFAPEVRHPVEVAVGQPGTAENRAQEAHLASWLTKRLDLPVKLFDLSAQGYELVGGRLLPDASGPSAQLMYERRPDAAASSAVPGNATSRVTVYLRKPRGDTRTGDAPARQQAPDPATTDTPASFSFERQGELNTFYWVEGATGYALVGALPRQQLLALAEAIYRQGR